MEPETTPPMEPETAPPMEPETAPPMGTRPRVVNLVLHLKVPAAGGYRRRLVGENDLGGGEWPMPNPALLSIPGVEMTMPKRKSKSVKRRNFYLLRIAGHIYTVFPASGDVVINGVPNMGRAREAVRSLSLALGHPKPGVREGVWGEKVVNSTYSGKLPGAGVHRRLLALKRAGGDVSGGGYKNCPSVSTRSQLFPGVLLRWKGVGTANVFGSGAYFIVGVKAEETAEDLHSRMCAAIEERCTTTNTLATSCARSAGSFWKRDARRACRRPGAGGEKEADWREELLSGRRGSRRRGGRERLHRVLDALSARSSLLSART